MNRFRALIISIKYAPGMPKEFTVIGENLKKRGWEVDYLLSVQYKKDMTERYPNENAQYIDILSHNMIKDYFINWKAYKGALINELDAGQTAYDYICVYNPHPLAGKIMRFFKSRNPQSKRSVVLHEPKIPFNQRLKYGLAGFLKCIFLDYFSTGLLINCTDVILPSDHAFGLYKQRHFPAKSRIVPHIIPLMLKPAAVLNAAPKQNYIAFVGTINKARRIDQLYELAKVSKEYDKNIAMSVLTSAKLDNENGPITIIKKEFVTDDDISAHIENALAVFLSHSIAAQSGNIPVAYRVGTPVLCNNVAGIVQHIKEGETGLILPDNYTASDIVSILDYFKDHQDNMRSQCLKYFDAFFSDSNFDKYYDWLIK